jgi:hypothetical protein
MLSLSTIPGDEREKTAVFITKQKRSAPQFKNRSTERCNTRYVK